MKSSTYCTDFHRYLFYLAHSLLTLNTFLSLNLYSLLPKSKTHHLTNNKRPDIA